MWKCLASIWQTMCGGRVWCRSQPPATSNIPEYKAMAERRAHQLRQVGASTFTSGGHRAKCLKAFGLNDRNGGSMEMAEKKEKQAAEQAYSHPGGSKKFVVYVKDGDKVKDCPLRRPQYEDQKEHTGSPQEFSCPSQL